MRKMIFFVLLVAVSIMGTLLVFRNTVARIVLSHGLTQAIGAETTIDAVDIGVPKPTIVIKGLKVYNPRGFINEPLLVMPLIAAQYDPDALFQRKIHLIQLKIALRELVVAINEKGAVNVDQLAVMHNQPQKNAAPLPEFKVDKLVLSVGRVVTKNYVHDESAARAGVDLGMRERTYNNITSVSQLAVVILQDTMKMAGWKGVQAFGERLLNNLGKNILKPSDAPAR